MRVQKECAEEYHENATALWITRALCAKFMWHTYIRSLFELVFSGAMGRTHDTTPRRQRIPSEAHLARTSHRSISGGRSSSRTESRWTHGWNSPLMGGWYPDMALGRPYLQGTVQYGQDAFDRIFFLSDLCVPSHACCMHGLPLDRSVAAGAPHTTSLDGSMVETRLSWVVDIPIWLSGYLIYKVPYVYIWNGKDVFEHIFFVKLSRPLRVIWNSFTPIRKFWNDYPPLGIIQN